MNFLVLLSSLLSTAVATNGYWDYTIDNLPKDGSKNVTFPMRLNHWPDERKWYIAQQITVEGCSLAYTGLQPSSDGMMVIFSSFHDGAQAINKDQCAQGADGGPGVSCKLTVPVDREAWYHLNVIKDGNEWTGTLIDTKTGNSSEIGKWSLPDECKGVGASNTGFLEEFVGDGVVPCDKKPRMDFDLKSPLAQDDSGEILPSKIDPSSLRDNSGSCEGKMGFKGSETVKQTEADPHNVIHVQNGFVLEN